MRRFDGWRIRVDHQTTFRYESPVRASYNEVRQSPLADGRQLVLESRIHTLPAAPQFAYADYWGNQAVSFNVDGRHDQLDIRSASLVETQPPPPVTPADWDQVAAFAARHAELTAATRYTPVDERLTDAVHGLWQSSPVATAEAVVAWAHGALRYEPGTTSVHTSATEAYDAGSGVCQDFAHLALTALRTVGIPARYVSGYLHPQRDAEMGQQTTGESHAWVEAWVGDWWGFDPSNDMEIGARHVVVARGRDYADVSPVRGVYAGDAAHTTAVSVTVTRVL